MLFVAVMLPLVGLWAACVLLHDEIELGTIGSPRS